MKNKSCPDKIACWDYNASNCEGCAVGDLILRQKKSIKRLKSELERYKRALTALARVTFIHADETEQGDKIVRQALCRHLCVVGIAKYKDGKFVYEDKGDNNG